MMRDFIKEQLLKSINYLEELIKQKQAAGSVPFEENEQNLKEAYSVYTKPHYSLLIFKHAFEDYLNNESNKYFKAAFINEIREIITRNVKKGVLKMPGSYSKEDLDKFDKDTIIPLHYSMKLLKEYNFPEEFIVEIAFGSQLRALSLLDKKPLQITELLYEFTIEIINYEILYSFILADNTLALEGPQRGYIVFDIAKNKYVQNQNRAYTQQELEKYLTSWFNATVNLKRWSSSKSIDVFKALSQLGLKKEDWERVRNHQIKLYKELFDEILSSYVTRLDNYKIRFTNELELARLDLALINDLIASDIDDAKAERLKSSFKIENWKQLSSQIGSILRKEDNSIDNYDIHSKTCKVKAEALLRYKRNLEDLLYHKEEDVDKSTINKPSNHNSKYSSTQSLLYLSFKYIHLSNKHDHITDLFNSLKDQNLICQETALPAFRKIFSGDPITVPQMDWQS